MIPELKAAARHPTASISSATGAAVSPPTAKPSESMLSASVRRLRNQFTSETTIARKLPSEAPIARLVIPKFGVDAPVVVRGIDGNGVMQSPDGPTDVAWYDFTARPGSGSNAVFSGHVDYINYGAAVFWNVRNLEMDDTIEVRLDDTTVYSYRVIAKEQINAATADVGTIVGHTEREIITLITCGGTFDPSSGQYDDRVIVQAERVFDDVAPGLPAGASAAPTS